uniref:RNase NYN domain-containing protein n=1 Tax=Panagrolaimus davidi TaxID=227884 RepID=A0A914QF74_9BILA
MFNNYIYSSDSESNTDDDASSTSSMIKESTALPRPIKSKQLQRLILIDAFNVMHHFKEIGLQECSTGDEKMCPLILIPLIMDFIQNGYVVRVVMKNMPDVKKTSDLYILDFLQHMDLLLYPQEDDLEKDDLLLLHLAEKYGALIITNDQFRNHKGYETIADNNRIEYDKTPTGHFSSRHKESSEILQDEMTFKFTIALHEMPGKFIVGPKDEDYERVAESMKKFKQISQADAMSFKLLNMYIYSSWCFVYNYGIPDCVKKFLDADSFPIEYFEFINKYIAFEEDEKKKKKHSNYDPQLHYLRVRDDLSDTDLNPYFDDIEDVS